MGLVSLLSYGCVAFLGVGSSSVVGNRCGCRFWQSRMAWTGGQCDDLPTFRASWTWHSTTALDSLSSGWQSRSTPSRKSATFLAFLMTNWTQQVCPSVPGMVSFSLRICCSVFPNNYTTLHPFNILFSRTAWVSRYRKGKTSLKLHETRDDGDLGCNGISWTMCKQSASHARQIISPTHKFPHKCWLV